MKKLLLLLCLLAVSVCLNAQTKLLVADETFITQMKSGPKIETSNEEVFKQIFDEFKREGLKYTVTVKRDRIGWFRLYVITLKDDDLPQIKALFKRINQ